MKSERNLTSFPAVRHDFITFGRRLRLAAACAVLLAVSAQAQYLVTPADGLVSWWRGEGNANDSADSNHGSLLNGGTYAPGVIGSAFSLDGVNDHVRVANSGNLQFTMAMTASAWVRTDSYNRWNPIIVKWDAIPIGQRSFAFGIDPSGRGYFGVTRDGTDGGSVSALSSGAVALNTWTHLAGTYDGAFVRFYVNGVLESEMPQTGSIFVGPDDLAIGGVVGGVGVGSSAYNFRGLIDEAMVYNRALTGAEIVALATIPEPSTLGLLVLGIAGLCFRRAQRRN
jgi:hypothetical protein